MHKHLLRAFFVAAATLWLLAPILMAEVDSGTRQLSHDIFKQLIEINTTDSVGSTTVAAEAMAQRLRDAGFPASDVVVLGPNSRKGNMVARLHGTGAHKPVLLIGHLDVVEARRSDWTTDPFQFVEKDGYFYGRGTQDMKSDDAIWVTEFIRLKREGFKPDRDLILALTADEEGGKSNGVDWLIKNHRDLIDAEFVLNCRWRRRGHREWQAGDRLHGCQRETLRRLSAQGHQPRRAQFACRCRTMPSITSPTRLAAWNTISSPWS